jgi:hypothetical protein
MSDLRLPQGFCESLYKEDDWSFIIKLHALLEAVVTHLLVAHLQQDALLDVFARVEMSQEKTGKLAFAKALNLLTSNHRAYVRYISELASQQAGPRCLKRHVRADQVQRLTRCRPVAKVCEGIWLPHR